MEKYSEIDTRKERRICYLLLVILIFIIASGLSTLYVAYSLGLFVIENVTGESLQAINKVVRLKYDLVQHAGGLENYIKIRVAILAAAIGGCAVLLFYLHTRLMRLLKHYDQLRSAVGKLVKEK